MAILYVEGQQVSGAVDNAASISCLDKNGNKSTVQAELDKKGNGSGAGFEPVKMTQAEYDALPEEQQKSGAYLITDAKKLDALEVGFDDSETGLGVDNVQDAIVEQNKNMIKNNFSSDVTISTTHNSLDNSYVFEEDGYLNIYSPTANAGDYITGYLCSSTTTHKIYLIAQCVKAGYPNVKTVYVKKGMRFYYDSGNGTAIINYLY